MSDSGASIGSSVYREARLTTVTWIVVPLLVLALMIVAMARNWI